MSKRFSPTRMVALLALALLAVAAGAADVSETVLPNGLTVLIKEEHAAPVVVVDVWYKVGSRDEWAGFTGSSHLLEHMTYKGTKEFGKDDMRNLSTRNGALNNGATYYDYTHYHTTIASDRLDLILRMEASRMSAALIRQKDLDSERTVVLSELEGNENNPGRLLFQQVMAAAFTAHPYHWPVVGWRPDIEHVTADQLRAYYHKYYLPNNATLVIVGDVKTADALSLATRYFGRLKTGADPTQWTTPELPQTGERRVEVRRAGAAPIEMIAWHVPAPSPINNPLIAMQDDTPALMMLEQILGSGRLSRLYQQVVETRIGVQAWADTTMLRDGGIFSVGGVAAPGQSLAPLEQALLAEVERIKTTPPTADEMTRALHQAEADMIYQRDSVTDQAEQLGEAETVQGDWRYPDNLLKDMRAVTAADVCRVAKTYLTEENRTVGVFQPTGGGGRMPSSAIMGPTSEHPPFDAHLAECYYYGMPDTPALHSRQAGEPGSTTHDDSARGNAVTPALAPVQRERFALPNGIVLLVQENHANPTVAVSASLRAGKAYDPAGHTGVADMVANLLDRGTTTRTSTQIAAELEGAAADISTGTGWETMGVHGKALSGDTALLLHNIADLLRNATFPPAEIDKMREQMLAGVAMERDQPAEVARRNFYRAALPDGNPYRLASFDEEAVGVQGITRDDLLAFYQQHYTPSGLILAVVGDVSIADVRNDVQHYFGDWSGPQSPVLDFPVSSAQPANRLVTTVPDKSQVGIYVGNAGGLRRADPDYYAAQVMNMILGGGGALNSRLGDVIRDQNGLAYSLYSSFHASTGAGPWYTVLGVNPRNVDTVIPLLRQEITRMRTKGATQREVDDAVAYISGATAIGLETNTALANILQDAEFFHLGLDYPEKISTLYHAVTLEQVNASAQKYLQPDKLIISIAGSYPVHAPAP
jgi:zinc protease